MRNKWHLFVCILCVGPSVAEAYIGPGAGISAIGSFLALLGGIVLAIVGFVWFPLKRRFSRNKVKENAESDDGLVEPIADSRTDDVAGDVNRRPPEG